MNNIAFGFFNCLLHHTIIQNTLDFFFLKGDRKGGVEEGEEEVHNGEEKRKRGKRRKRREMYFSLINRLFSISKCPWGLHHVFIKKNYIFPTHF